MGIDSAAFNELYRDHHPAVFRFVRGVTGDPVKAAEVTQDVFVWLIHNPDRFDSERGSMSAFLIGVARRFLQHREHKERRWVELNEAVHLGSALMPVADQPENAELRSAIAALPERYREAVVLCDLEEFSYEEAAKALECAVGTVRSRLHRARQLLARKLLATRQEEKKQNRECPV